MKMFREKFKEYINKHNIRNDEIAKSLGVSIVTISHYKTGRNLPKDYIRYKLIKMSNGFFKAEDFIKYEHMQSHNI